MTAIEWKTFFVWRVTYICVHITQAQFLPTSSKHVSPDMQFQGLGIVGLSHQSCIYLHIGTNNIVGGSIKHDFLEHRGKITGQIIDHVTSNVHTRLYGIQARILFQFQNHRHRFPSVVWSGRIYLPGITSWSLSRPSICQVLRVHNSRHNLSSVNLRPK